MYHSMNQYKICVYAICKNEEQFVDRWMDSMAEADMIIVVDTGSTDQTVEKLRSRGAIVYEEKIDPWRFDTARNISLSYVPDDMDIAVCTDLDEVFRPGWRACLESAWTSDATMGNHFKIHKKNLYTWACPVHEYLKYTGTSPQKKVFIGGMVLDHYPDQTKSRSSYLPLLEMAVKEDPSCDRMAYYLGREYMYAERWQDCIDTLTQHLRLKTAVQNEERCASMRWIAKSYSKLNNNREAYRWYYRAISEVPSMRDAYIEFAKLAYEKEDWLTVFFLTSEALKITEKSNEYVSMDYSWDHTPDDLATIACYQLGLYERALMHAQKALSFAPDDERLQNNYQIIKKEISINKKLKL